MDEKPDLPDALARDWRAADLSPRLSAILAFSEELTRDPGGVGKGDVERLRDAGLDDEAVLHVVEVVSYFNFVNRMADGLGVTLEDHWAPPYIGETGEDGDAPGAEDRQA